MQEGLTSSSRSPSSSGSGVAQVRQHGQHAAVVVVAWRAGRACRRCSRCASPPRPGVTTSARAIAAFVRPSAISSSTSRSRGVSAPSAPSRRRGRVAAPARRRPRGRARCRRRRRARRASTNAAHVAHPLLEQVADPALAGGRAARPCRPARRTGRGSGRRGPGSVARASIAARMPSSVNVGGSRTSTIARSGLWPAMIRSRPGAVLGLRDHVDVRARAAARRCPRAAAPGPRRSRPARQLRADGRPLARLARDDQRAVERLDAVAQAGQPAARGVGAARAVVGDLDDAARRRRASTRHARRRAAARAWRRWSAPRRRRSRPRSRPPAAAGGRPARRPRPGSRERRPSASTAAARPRSASTGGAIPRARSRSSAIAALASLARLADQLGDLGLVGEPLLGAARAAC